MPFNIPFIIPVLVLLLLVHLVFIVIRRRRQPRITAPSCGRCLYEVRGLQSTTCPECGSNLLEVGVLTPQQQYGRPVSFMQKLTLWSGVVLLLAVLLTGPLLSFLPSMSAWQGNVRMTLRQPTSSAYRHIRLQQQFQCVRGGQTIDVPVRLQLFKHDSRAPVEARVDVVNDTIWLVNDDVTMTERLPLNEETLYKWQEHNEISLAPADIEREMGELMVVVTDPIIWQRMLPSGSGQFSQTTSGFTNLAAFFSSNVSAKVAA